MNKIIFEWDENKAENISFEEAQTVFFDEDALQFWDEKHSCAEDRFLMLGMSSRLRLLLVVNCYREEDSTIRIISARKATKREQREYPGESL